MSGPGSTPIYPCDLYDTGKKKNVKNFLKPNFTDMIDNMKKLNNEKKKDETEDETLKYADFSQLKKEDQDEYISKIKEILLKSTFKVYNYHIDIGKLNLNSSTEDIIYYLMCLHNNILTCINNDQNEYRYTVHETLKNCELAVLDEEGGVPLGGRYTRRPRRQRQRTHRQRKGTQRQRQRRRHRKNIR